MGDAELQLQRNLDGYAQNAATGENLERYLAGEALDSARHSAELLQSLGLSQIGTAELDITSINGSRAVGCIDLSAVQIVDGSGALIQPNRASRLSFAATFDSSFSITRMEVGGPC